MPIATVNPATGDVVRTFEPHPAAEVERRLQAASDATTLLRHSTYEQRARWMCAAADLIEADSEDLARVLTLEMGKPVAQSRAEVLKCAKAMRFYAQHAATFLADDVLEDPTAVGASQALTRYRPLGVVLAVMPWNYPLWQVVRFAAPALMAGNCGLLKHASNVPQAALYLDTLFARGGFPAGAFQTVLVGASEVDALIADDRVAAVTITGSEPAGRAVGASAGRHIKRVVLELGGSDPFIVMPSADIDAAVEAAVRARILNNGQSCVAAKRFIVHSDVYDAFASRFVAAMSELVVGDPTDPRTDVGPLATAGGRADIVELVDDAIAKGATVLAGGTTRQGPGYFYPPTVLADLTPSMRIVLEETFGPVASLYRVSDRSEALEVANQTPFGLSSAVWTDDPDDESYFIDGLEAGGVFVNGMTVSFPELPFGGIKNSGHGRELAAAGIREFCNLTTVWRG